MISRDRNRKECGLICLKPKKEQQAFCCFFNGCFRRNIFRKKSYVAVFFHLKKRKKRMEEEEPITIPIVADHANEEKEGTEEEEEEEEEDATVAATHKEAHKFIVHVLKANRIAEYTKRKGKGYSDAFATLTLTSKPTHSFTTKTIKRTTVKKR